MAESVFDRIALLRQRTTKQERAIIDCLSNNNITNLSYLSITEFASLANVAESTLLRFCRKLGLRGYSEFRHAVGAEQQQRIYGRRGRFCIHDYEQHDDGAPFDL